MFHSSIDKISPTKLDELSDTERQNLIKYNNAIKYSNMFIHILIVLLIYTYSLGPRYGTYTFCIAGFIPFAMATLGYYNCKLEKVLT